MNNNDMTPALAIYMGRKAAALIGERGWRSAPWTTLMGASGGPKWLILSEMDRILGKELLSQCHKPITLMGSSIGTWRHACLSLPDPATPSSGCNGRISIRNIAVLALQPRR